MLKFDRRSAALLTILAGFGFAAMAGHAEDGEKQYIVTERSNLRKTPSVEGEWIMSVPEGALVEIIGGETDGYTLIEYDGVKGFVNVQGLKDPEAAEEPEQIEQAHVITAREVRDRAMDAAEIREQQAQEIARSIAPARDKQKVFYTVRSAVNFRAEASGSSERLGMIMPGDNVEFLDEGENGYMHVKFNDRKGYIISSVVEDMSSAGRNASALPMREVALTEGMVEGSQTITTSASAAMKKAPQKQAPQLSYQINVKTNLRDLPEESDNLLATLPAGTSVMLLGQKGDYAMVQYDGMTGYVLGSSVVNSLDYAKEHGTAVLFTLTGYCSCHICCGQYSPEITGGEAHTATGTVPQEGRTIAVDPRVIPYGSRVTIEGWGTYVAEDCGGGVKGNHIDMYFSTHEAARQFGRQQLYVTFEK